MEYADFENFETLKCFIYGWMDGMGWDGMDGMGWDGRLSRSIRLLRAPNGANKSRSVFIATRTVAGCG